MLGGVTTSSSQRRTRRASLAALTCLAAVPAVALAGKTVIAGHQSLKLTASATPNHAGGSGVRLSLHVDYESLIPGKRLDAAEKDIKLTLPAGMRIDPSAAKACPRSSIVGSGKVTADARPAIATPVDGTVTLFNVRGQHHDIVLEVATKFGNFFDLFIIRKSGAHTVLDAAFTPPPPGSNGLYTVKTLDLTFHNAPGGKPYITNPPSCPKAGWPASLSIASYGPEPTITAAAAIACR